MTKIYVGIGGWVFEEWRDNFYPKGLSQKRELEYASRQLTSIEINGTYYGSQKPESFARWHDETPDDFVFALKGLALPPTGGCWPRRGPSVEKFLESGITRLKKKLGPINWQFYGDQEIRRGRFRSFSATVAPNPMTGRKRSDMPWKCGMKALPAPSSWRFAAGMAWPPFSPPIANFP